MQSGFRSSLTTITALLKKKTNKLASAIDKDEVVLLLLLEYSKAFDVIDDRLLVTILKYYSLDVNTTKWFDEYLSNKKQDM